MGNSQIKAGLNGELVHTLKGLSNDALKTKNEYIVKLLTTLDAHQSVEDGINSNESLSQQGKLEALKKLGTNETAPSLKWTTNILKEMRGKELRYRTQFFTITWGIENAVERMLTYTYLWGKFDPMDQSARVTQFLQSAERDDIRVMAAMLENPFGPMVDKEVKERALTERAKRLTPNDYQNFEQNQILLEFLVVFRDWIARWLNQEVGVDTAVIRATFGDEIADALAGV